MSASNSNLPSPAPQPGDVVNGFMLTRDGNWLPVGQAPPPVVKPAKYSGFAGWSFGLGLFGMLLFEIFLLQLLAISFGIIALAGVKRGERRGGWMAIVGIILGVLYLFVAVVRQLQRAAGLV